MNRKNKQKTNKISDLVLIGQRLRLWKVMFNSLRPHGLAHQAPLSMGFSRQEYWSGLPCPPLGDLPSPGIEPVSHVSCIGRWILYH